MSRRPRVVAEQRVNRAMLAMLPTLGRLASESPVVRPRFTGGAPLLTVVGPLSYNGTAWALGYTAPEPDPAEDPPIPVYMTPAGVNFVPEQGHAVTALIVAYDAGTITLPSGWTLAASGTAGDLSWWVAWQTHLTATGDNEVTFSAWDVETSRGVFAVWEHATDGEDFSYDLNVGTPVVDYSAGSQANAQPSSGWGSGWSITIMMSTSGTLSSPYYTVDPSMDVAGIVGVNDGLGGEPKINILWPYDGDHAPVIANATFGTTGTASATFVTFPMGWT